MTVKTYQLSKEKAFFDFWRKPNLALNLLVAKLLSRSVAFALSCHYTCFLFLFSFVCLHFFIIAALKLIGQLIAHLYKQCRQEQTKVLHNVSSPLASTRSSSSSSSSASCMLSHHLPFSSTTDGYTGRDHDSYFGFTIHFFSIDWCLRRMLLKIKLCEDRHIGENICKWLEEAFDESELDVGASFSVLRSFSFTRCCISSCCVCSGVIVLP